MLVPVFMKYSINVVCQIYSVRVNIAFYIYKMNVKWHMRTAKTDHLSSLCTQLVAKLSLCGLNHSICHAAAHFPVLQSVAVCYSHKSAHL